MRAGPYEVRSLSTGRFALDGGAMFGNVPYTLWSRHHKPDERFRIELDLRVLVAEGDGRRILVDTGSGHLWSPKEQEIYRVSADPEPPVCAALRSAGIEPESITDVVLTHLHFDHAGGVSRRDGRGGVELTFQDAVHHVQERNLATAKSPNLRERASYLPHHWKPVSEGRMNLLRGGGEILPGVFAHLSDGHTEGLQVVRIGEGGDAVAFPADMIPLAEHVQIPWTMGYDLWVRRLMEEKEAFLRDAERLGWVVVLEHDPRMPAVRVARRDGRFVAGESVEI